MIYFEYKHKDRDIENGIYQNFKLNENRKTNGLGVFIEYKKKLDDDKYHTLCAWVMVENYEPFREGTIVDKIIKLGIKKSLRVLKLKRINN